MRQFKNTPYYVTENGDVYRDDKKLKPYIDKEGYKRIRITENKIRKNFRIHRLVAECYISNPNNLPQIDHIDCNKLNNHISNLEWVTEKENIKRAVNNGLYLNRKTRGVDKRKRKRIDRAKKLNNDDILWIKENYIPRHSKFGARALAKKFNVNHGTILNVFK